MTTYSSWRWYEIILLCWGVAAACSTCLGATGSTEVFTTGTYAAQNAAPDYLTTTKAPQMADPVTLRVTGGNAFPERPFDAGKVLYHRTASQGATACFAGRSSGTAAGGRSTGWGCAYTVWGVLVSGSGGTAPAPTWWSKFKDDNKVRIALEVNQDGKSDDYIAVQATGQLYVWVQGGSATEYTVKLEAGAGILFANGLSSASIQVAGQGGMASAILEAQATPGTVNISARFDPAIEGATSPTTTVTVTDIAVTFSRAELRPGVGAARADTVHVTATRTGGGPEVTIDFTSNHARASVASGASLTLAQGQNHGVQAVTVRGNSASAADQDTLLQANVGATLKNSIPISVVVPAKWTNDALGPERTAGPQLVPGTPGVGDWAVRWNTSVVFTALDQFDRALAPLWAGVQLWEKVGNGQWTGFHSESEGDPISASAQATDPLHYQKIALTQQDAQDIVSGALLLPTQTVVDADIVYRITDGNAVYSLTPANKRLFQIKAVSGANTLVNRETQH